MKHDLRARILTVGLALAALSATHSAALAADIDGFPLCTAPGDQLTPVIVADGAGGFIAAWHDLRPTVPAGGVCFAQRVNSAGTPQWALNGVALSTFGDLSDPTTPAIAADGAGGAFVAYGGSTAQPRVQWVNAAGSPQWGPDGVLLTNATPGMRDLAIVRDSPGGGVIVVWRQVNSVGGTSDIHAQKVNAAGAVQWGAGGIAVTSTNMNSETLPNLISDDAGGAIIVHLGSNGCRAYRLNSAGVSQWGTTILGALANNRRPAIVTDGAGGAVVGWAAGNTGIFVQRVTSIGNRAWAPTNAGVQLNTTGNQCAMIPDGAGGATVTWQEHPGTNYNIFAQRVDGAGATQWAGGGVAVSFVQNDQLAPMIVSDGGTGAIVTWYDGRTFASGNDIYAQRIEATAGASQWTADGSPVCTVANDQLDPTIAADATGGAFVCWQDRRSGTNEDIYFHHLNGNGVVLSAPVVDPAPWMTRAWPNPFFASVRLAFVLPAAASVRLEVFDVRGRSVRAYEPELLAAGEQALAWDGRSSDGHAAGPGIYYMRVSGPGIALSRRVVRLE